MQRPLWLTLTDLIAGALPISTEAPLRVTGVAFDVPLEVVFSSSGLLADLPAWRWRTDFDLPLGRLRLRLGEVEDSA